MVAFIYGIRCVARAIHRELSQHTQQFGSLECNTIETSKRWKKQRRKFSAVGKPFTRQKKNAYDNRNFFAGHNFRVFVENMVISDFFFLYWKKWNTATFVPFSNRFRDDYVNEISPL